VIAIIFEVWPRAVHVWHLYAGLASAGERAIARVAEFVRRRLADEGQVVLDQGAPLAAEDRAR